ncbi:MAG: deoxyribodipyrimidine photo-lyase, partial [Psychrosphaera sp.]|nr:deoxyribodipyrimidine photo-lyase [Psychrosphaera sp.]
MAINVVWFKRDLRLSDHEPLKAAISTGRPTLLWFNFEPWLVNDPHYDERHWRFIVESIRDINLKLKVYNTQIYVTYGDAVEQLQLWHQQFYIKSLYSHQEVGLLNTFDRDKQVASWCRQHDVNWYEIPTGAVQRGLNNRQQWQKHWYGTMKAPLATPDLARIQPVKAVSVDYRTLPKTWFKRNSSFQYGGPTAAVATLTSFL